jgi:uncharacterized protein YggE
VSMQPTVVVRGEALREVPPELAVFSVTVSARDRDKEAVLTRLTGRAAEVRAMLDGYGEAIERRETGGVHVYPEFKRGTERAVAYTGSVSATVTVTDFTALGEMLLRLAALEQAAVAGPWWQLRPGSTAGAEVRREAIADALTRAREYASAVGARIDRLVEIADEGTGGAAPMWAADARATRGAVEQALVIDPQQQTVHASVIVRVTITEPDLPS